MFFIHHNILFCTNSFATWIEFSWYAASNRLTGFARLSFMGPLKNSQVAIDRIFVSLNEGTALVTCESPSQTNSAEFWCFLYCLPQQPAEQAVEFPEIWDQSWQGHAPVNGGFMSKKASNMEAWCFLFLLAWISSWTNSKVAEDVRSKHTNHRPLVMNIPPRAIDGEIFLVIGMNNLFNKVELSCHWFEMSWRRSDITVFFFITMLGLILIYGV